MASAYDKASLVMLPNAYKDGKVYSVKPEDRSGDFTFTRSTAATRVDVNGLIEKGRENLLLQSNQFDTTWGNITTTEFGGQIGYDGSSNAWRINLNAGTTLKAVNQNFTAYSGVSTASFYAKAGAHSIVQFGTASQNNVFVAFDLSSGLVGSLSSEVIDASATSLGNGWYRIQVAYKASGAAGFVIAAVDSLSTTRFSSTSSTGDFYIQDAQLEQGLVATDYIETGASTAQAGITDNVPRLDYTDSSCPALLLEPLRSNLVTQSEYFETSEWNTPNVVFETNKAISPDGGLNATKFRANSANSTHWASTDVTLTSGQDYTFKLYVKSAEYDWVQISLFGTGWVGSSKKINFNASTGEFGTTDTGIVFDSNPMGNGWHEVFITNEAASTSGVIRVYPMPSDNATSYQGDGSSGLYIFGAQLEKGSYPTSYIPTYGSSVSRVADSCSKTGISNLIGQTEGTLFLEAKITLDGRLIYLGQAGNFIETLTKSNGQINAFVRTSATQADILSSTTFATGNTIKLALAYAENDFALYINGVQEGSDTNGVVPSNMAGVIMNNYSNAGYASANAYNQALLFPTRLTDSELTALTTI